MVHEVDEIFRRLYAAPARAGSGAPQTARAHVRTANLGKDARNRSRYSFLTTLLSYVCCKRKNRSNIFCKPESVQERK